MLLLTRIKLPTLIKVEYAKYLKVKKGFEKERTNLEDQYTSLTKTFSENIDKIQTAFRKKRY